MKIINFNKKIYNSKVDLHYVLQYLNKFYKFFKQLIRILKGIY